MATSLILTRDDIIKAALRRIAALSEGETPSATQVTDAAQALNVIVKQFDSAPWIKYLMKSAEQTFSTSSGTASYDLAADDLWIETMTIQITTDIDIPLKIITVGEYNLIIDKARAGTPTHAYVTDDLDIPGATIPDQKVFLWPTPNATLTVNYISRRKMDLFDSSADFSNFPDAWTRYVIFQLAADLAFEYKLELNKIVLLQQSADTSLQFAMQDQVKQIDGQEIQRPSLELNSVDESIKTKRPTIRRG